jgi:outer membrane receptor for ferrienterochelin and colicin
MFRVFLLILSSQLAGLFPAVAQEDTTHLHLMESSLERLLTTTVADAPRVGVQQSGIADLIDQDIREAPGIVQILTSAEMDAAGCRTLEDALMLIPSFSMGRDVDDMLGMGIRGQWAHEGKCLFMLNGMPLNESSYGIYALGLRFTLDHISRIEVINGPGSVMYGGFAALGVVNIVTKTLADEEALKFSVTGSTAGSTPNYKALDLSGQHRVSPDTELDYQAGLVLGQRFAPKGQLADGSPISYQDSSGNQTLSGFFRVLHKGFQGQFYVNDHMVSVSDALYDVQMRTVATQGTKRLTIGRKAQFDLTAHYRVQLPWSYTGLVSVDEYRTNTLDQRVSLNGTFLFKVNKALQLTWGISGYSDHFKYQDHHPEAVFAINGRRRIAVNDLAAFGEARLRGKWGSLLAGVRGEHHDLGGELASPRFAYTGLFGPFNVKAIHSTSFKMPTLQNVNAGRLDMAIRPEVVATQELEFGWRSGKGLNASIVAFRTRINDPIVYVLQADSSTTDSYINRGSSSSEGVEARVSYAHGKTLLTASFSTYRADLSRTDLPEVVIPENAGGGFLGLPQTKATFLARFQLRENTRLGCSAIWNSDTWACQYTDTEQSVMELIQSPSWTRVGFTVSHAFTSVKGLEMTVRADNLLDDRIAIHSPYNNGLSSLPLPGREFTLKLVYSFPI